MPISSSQSFFDSNLSISSNFEKLSQQYYHNRLQRSNENPTGYSLRIELLYSDFGKLKNSIQNAKLYSPINETVKDIKTADLKFLIIDFYMGQLMYLINDINKRLNSLIKAKTHFEKFAKLMNQLEISSKNDQKSLHNLLDQNTEQQKNSSAKSNPMQIRNDAIERLKRMKDIENNLELLTQKLGFPKSHISHSNDNFIKKKSSENSFDNENDDSINEELQREYWLTSFEQSILIILKDFKHLDTEIGFLNHRAELERKGENEISRSSVLNNQKSDNHSFQTNLNPPVFYKITPETVNNPVPTHMKNYLQRIQHANNPSAIMKEKLRNSVVNQPNAASISSPIGIESIVSNLNSDVIRRSQFSSTVFRDPNPALLSVEEWARQEQLAGRLPMGQSTANMNKMDQKNSTYIKTQKEQHNERENDSEESDVVDELDDLESLKLADQNLYEQREWDNWKDEHEKGIGNRMK